MADDQYVAGLLAEESGESVECIGLLLTSLAGVVKQTGRAARFGVDSPSVEGTPRHALARELGDVLAAVDFAIAHGAIDAGVMFAARSLKYERLTDPSRRDNLGRPLAPPVPPSAADSLSLRFMPRVVDAVRTYHCGGDCQMRSRVQVILIEMLEEYDRRTRRSAGGDAS